MTLLADRILAERPDSPGWNIAAKQVRDFQNRLRRSAIVNVNNVAEYLRQDTDANLKYSNMADLPTLAPPFPCFWMEWDAWRFRIGVLFRAVPDSEQRTKREDGQKWAVEIIGIQSLATEMRFMPFGFELLLDDEGKLISLGVGALSGGEYKGISREKAPDKVLMAAHVMEDTLAPAFMAISLMHCKNVTVTDILPNLTLSRKRQKRTGQELLRFKTLSVFSMQRMPSHRSGEPSSEHGVMPIHIQRGHFKHFTADRRLFGRHEGTFWWESHIRGDKTAGILTKHYAVRTKGIDYATAH